MGILGGTVDDRRDLDADARDLTGNIGIDIGRGDDAQSLASPVISLSAADQGDDQGG